MNRILVFWLLCPIVIFAQANTSTLEDKCIWVNGDEHPYLLTCEGAPNERRSCTEKVFWKTLMDNLSSPEVPDTLAPKAYVILQFDITTEGYMENARIARNRLGPSFGDEALKALLAMTDRKEEMRWVPFKSFGKPYKTTYTFMLRREHFKRANTHKR
ncbi:MAG: hypothetical protein KI786_17395 [Mameliella sp.]|nr:hypothetical protein [Phaeodactylibacter sp.]NRA47756.1 hypothetical protein [Phaeodactylibacter sp.]